MSEWDNAPTQEYAGTLDSPKISRQVSVVKSVEMHIAEAKRRLEELEKVHELLTKNPEIHELLTLMRRIGI